jgi:hypothetical protein
MQGSFSVASAANLGFAIAAALPFGALQVRIRWNVSQ